MAFWTNNYKNVPANFKNPGQGAYHLRDTKEAVEQRETREHIWGQPELDQSLPGGLHREGSARVFVTDEGTDNRGADEAVTAHSQRIGRVYVDLMKRTSKRQQDGVDLPNASGGDIAAQLKKTITVYSAQLDANNEPVDGVDPELTDPFVVFDYDAFVDIHQDQSINGIKDFTLSPQVPNYVKAGETVPEAWKDVIDTGTIAEKKGAVNIAESYVMLDDAKQFNNFDPDEPDNDDFTIIDEDAPEGLVMPLIIRATDIYATKLRGAVYG